jgi:hypothetical protein
LTWTTPATPTLGQLVTSSYWDPQVKNNLTYLKDKQDTVKYGQRTTNTSAFSSSETDIVTAAAFTPVDSSRLLRVSVVVRGLQFSVATDIFVFRIKEGSTQLQERTVRSESGGTGTDGFDFWVYIPNPTAASHTYKLTGGRVDGTGTCVIQADATYPCQILVEDCGAA